MTNERGTERNAERRRRRLLRDFPEIPGLLEDAQLHPRDLEVVFRRGDDLGILVTAKADQVEVLAVRLDYDGGWLDLGMFGARESAEGRSRWAIRTGPRREARVPRWRCGEQPHFQDLARAA